MAGRISRGFALLRASWNVLKLDKELMVFPILSFLACLAVLAVIATPVALTPSLREQFFAEGGGPEELGSAGQAAMYALLFLYYLVSYFLMIFFNTALVSCALIRFRGGDPTVSDGLRGATARLPQILAWSLLAATVGLVLHLIEERVKLVGKIVVRFVGAAWTIVTYFVVPVLAVEKLGPLDAIKRSTELLRKTWGESLIGQLSLGLATVLLSLPGIAVMILGGLAMESTNSPWLLVGLIGLGALYLLVLAIAVSAMRQIFLTGMYLYASTGQVAPGFSEDLMRSAFRSKG